jgi:hypothetical protein
MRTSEKQGRGEAMDGSEGWDERPVPHGAIIAAERLTLLSRSVHSKHLIQRREQKERKSSVLVSQEWVEEAAASLEGVCVGWF